MSSQVISKKGFSASLNGIRFQPGLAFGIVILTALVAFEIFNFSTTEFALLDLLGDLQFMGLRWATILAVAFCCIDFAGIARLSTPEQAKGEIKEVWYLFGAWLLAATMNAMLTWWGVSTAIMHNQNLGNAVVDRAALLRVVPIFVAILVWMIRVLIIGSFSVAGANIFGQGNTSKRKKTKGYSRNAAKPAPVQGQGRRTGAARAVEAPHARSFQPAPKPPQGVKLIRRSQPSKNRPEPTYHPLSSSASGAGGSQYAQKPVPIDPNTRPQLHN
jgi:hypothetical protein